MKLFSYNTAGNYTRYATYNYSGFDKVNKGNMLIIPQRETCV